jgi:hypothetical protein
LEAVEQPRGELLPGGSGGSVKAGENFDFNTDQGVQFTSEKFSSMVIDVGMKFSMDGQGRTFGNIFTERLWRTVKYEAVDLKDYLDGLCAHRQLGGHSNFYNERRLHQALKNRTPREVHFEDVPAEAVKISTRKLEESAASN